MKAVMIQPFVVMTRCCHKFRVSISMAEDISHDLESIVFLEAGLSAFNLSTSLLLLNLETSIKDVYSLSVAVKVPRRAS